MDISFSELNLKNATPKMWAENERHYLSLLPKCLKEIPSLNTTNISYLRDGMLVRFKGMIQDMHGPEYYLDQLVAENEKTKVRTMRSGKFLDLVECYADEVIDYDSPDTITKERQTFVVISTPAENNWVTASEALIEKNIIVCDNDSESSTKRPHEDEDVIIEMKTELVEKKTDFQDNFQKKSRSSTHSMVAPELIVSLEHLLNFPIPESAGRACLVKLYTDDNSCKLNDVREFVGFLSVHPNLSCDNSDEGNIMEIQTHHPPPSLIPRLHCVYSQRVELDNSVLSSDIKHLENIGYVRKEFMILLTQLLLGDELAAEYLLFYLISKIYIRKDGFVLGKFSLNLSNVPQFVNIDYGDELYKFLEMILVKSHYLPLTVENLNELAFIPKKDYESNRLTSGILQVSANTYLVLDETKMAPGKLNEAGVKAIQTVSEAITNQKIAYDFNYYPIEFECDIPFLILSQGKSILPSDSHVIIKPEKICVDTFVEILQAAKHFLRLDLLTHFRKYVAFAQMIECEISDSIHVVIQNDFVEMRQKGARADDLHHLLVLSRLISVSHGRTTLDEDSWKHACRLEESRVARMKKK